jgi:4-hydroxy-tetrahydrodipicolinate reductase
MVKIGVLGAKGKMGSLVCSLITSDYSKKAILQVSSDKGDNVDSLIESDVVIDFSEPTAVVNFVKKAQAKTRVPALVVGSTGWRIDERKILEEYVKRAPVIMSSNFSTAVWALTETLKNAAPLFEKLGYQAVIVETHHIHKKDSPSGTALSLQRAIAPAGPGNIPTHSIRAGEVIGDHEVTFYGVADKIKFAHYAVDRTVFARGAVDTAIWLVEKKNRPVISERKALIGMDLYFKDITREKAE